MAEDTGPVMTGLSRCHDESCSDYVVIVIGGRKRRKGRQSLWPSDSGHVTPAERRHNDKPPSPRYTRIRMQVSFLSIVLDCQPLFRTAPNSTVNAKSVCPADSTVNYVMHVALDTLWLDSVLDHASILDVAVSLSIGLE